MCVTFSFPPSVSSVEWRSIILFSIFLPYLHTREEHTTNVWNVRVLFRTLVWHFTVVDVGKDEAGAFETGSDCRAERVSIAAIRWRLLNPYEMER